MASSNASYSDLVAAFERDGFAYAPTLFDAAAVRGLASCCDELQAWSEAPGKYMKYFEDSRLERGRRVLSRIENFCPYHPAFDALVHDRRLMGAIEALFGEPAVLFKDKINFKLPGGDGFKAHQDAQAGWDRYAGYYMTALVSIDAETVENGCLEMAAGRRRQGLIGRMWEPLSDAEVEPDLFVPYPTAPGDVMFFDSFAPHRTAPHRTAPHRTAPHRTAPHRTAPHRTAPHRTAPHRTAPHRTAPHRTAPHRTAPHRTAPHRTAPHRTAPHRTAPHRTAPHRTAPHRTAPHRTAPHRTAPHRTAPHRTAPHRTAPPAPHRTAPHRTAPHRTAPHRTAPHRTAPHRTAPHRTAPHRTAPHRTAPHRTGPNMTAAPRRVLYLTYNRRSDGDHRRRYYADKRESYPPDCEREPGESYAFKV